MSCMVYHAVVRCDIIALIERSQQEPLSAGLILSRALPQQERFEQWSEKHVSVL